jgi:hypothetical protein
VLSVFYSGQDLALGSPVALQFIRDDDARNILTPFEELAEELLRRLLIPPPLHEDVEHIPVLIDGAPEVMALTWMVRDTSSRCHLSPG